MKYTEGLSCFVLWFIISPYHETHAINLSIFFRVASLVLGELQDCVNEITLKDMGKTYI